MFKALFSAKGRMRRRDWWLWSIGLSLAFFVAGLLLYHLFGTKSLREEIATFGQAPLTPVQGWIIFVNTLGYYPFVCITAKRWHDRNRSGWLAASWPAVGIPQFAVSHLTSLVDSAGLRFALGAAQIALGIASIVLVIAILIDCGILDGTKGSNRYGPSPKGVGDKVEDVF